MKLLLLILLLIAAYTTQAAGSTLPDLAGSTSNGLHIEIYSELSPLRINQIHSWRIRILDANNKALSVEVLEVSGGMPEHDHGLPTQPQITKQMENGDYLLEGVRFHMQGKWLLQIDLQNNGSKDQALIDFLLQ